MNNTETLRYPIGRFAIDADVNSQKRDAWINDIQRFPAAFRAVVEPLSSAQLDTRYRPEGWTVRRLVHHVADSHMNAYIRFKLAITEDNPTIKTYDQDLWANLADTSGPVALSLDILGALHARWDLFLRSLATEDFDRPFNHPESGPMKVSDLLQLYSWHGRHHTAHVANLVAREGW